MGALRRLHKHQPNNPEFLYYVGLGYEDLQAPGRAVRWFRKVLKVDPNRSDVHFHLGIAWDQLKRFPRAESFLRRAVELDPKSGAALNYLGYSWTDRDKNLPQALELIERAVALDPDNAAYLDSLGWVYFKLGRLREAELVLGRAALKAEDALVWQHYGDCFQSLSRREDAVRAWREGLLLSPRSKELRKRLGKGRSLPAIRKRVEENFQKVQSLTGFMQLNGRENGHPLRAQGLFTYVRPQFFRLEILGPFFTPQALLVQNAEGLRGRTADGQEVDFTWVRQWLRVFEHFLSGDILKEFDGPAVQVRQEGRRLLYRNGFSELEIDEKKKVLTRISWRSDGIPAYFRLRGYRKIDGLWLPSSVDFDIPGQNTVFSMDLGRMKVNSSPDPALFRLP
jgi:tetratricopeptide (TPR) repeat protein